MSSKYVMLECNRLRSKTAEASTPLTDDDFKNRWTNVVSSSGIRINTGDVINVQQSIINTIGASDEVIEFTGDPNDDGFVDNKTQLTLSYYVNHTGRNTFALPSLFHKCYNGVGSTLNPTLSNLHPTSNAVTVQTKNDATGFQLQVMLASRSLGEMLFAPLKNVGTNPPVFDGGALTNTDRFNGLYYPWYFNANYLFRLSVEQTGVGISETTGYFPNQIYPVQKSKSGLQYLAQNITGGDVGSTTFQCDYVPQVFALPADPTGYRVTDPTTNTVYGIIQSITDDYVRSSITLVSALTVDLKTTGQNVLLVPSAPAGVNDTGIATGVRIRVLQTSGRESDPPNAIEKWEIAEIDVDRPNAVRKGDLLILPFDIAGQSLGLSDATWAKFRVNTTLDQAGFCSSNVEGVDGSRNYLTNVGYTGLTNSDEVYVASITDALDLGTINDVLDKRKTTVDLEMKPSFSTPDNVGTILTDQMTAPEKLSLSNPKDDFFNLTFTDYTFKQTQPRGVLLDPVSTNIPNQARFQSSVNIKPQPKEAIVTTPTYKPITANMYGKGIPNVSIGGVERNGDQASWGGLRRMFYSSVAYKEMDRVVALKDAFYNFKYPFAIDGGTTNFGRDIYPMTADEEYLRQASSEFIFGDFGNVNAGKLGHRVCCLSKFDHNGVQVTLPKNSLIITNMKFTRSNIERLSKNFRKIESYLGDLSQKVDTTSADYKQRVSVNLDMGMYSDEESTNGRLQVYTGNVDPPPSQQRIRYGTTFEGRMGFITGAFTEVDRGGVNTGFQRDFDNLANDTQQLSSIWVKSRWQEGFTYDNTKSGIDGYTGDYMSDPDAFIQRQTDSDYYAIEYYKQSILNQPAHPSFDLKLLALSETDFTTPLATLSTSSAEFEQPFAVGQTIVVTQGTIGGADATGRTAVIEAVDMNHTLPSLAKVRLLTLAGSGLGLIGSGVTGVKVQIVANVSQRDFFTGTWSSDGNDTLTEQDAYKLSREFDVACVPMFQPINQQDKKTSGWRNDDNVPLIAFISSYELGAMNINNFDFVNLGSNTNLWQLDQINSIQGIQLGLDPSFTRNPAVAISNTQYGNLDDFVSKISTNVDAPKNAFVNMMYVGAVSPSIDFNGALSRFEISGLNTPYTVGNGLPTDIPDNLIANPTPEQQVYAVNVSGRIYPARAKLVGAIAGVATGTRNPVYDQFTSVQKYGTIMDSQSGVAIESIGLYDIFNNVSQITSSDTDKFYNTLLFKLGFDLNQLLIDIGNSQNFFVNNIIFQDIFTYEKSLQQFIKPMTTGAYISSAQIQALSLNSQSMPLFDLGTETCILEATPDATQGSITAFRLPQKLDYPYLVIYSSITGGSCDTHFIGGSDSQSLLPAVAYLTRNENNGDFFYGLESDITFTAVKDFTLTEVEIDVRRPDGKKPRLNPHSAIIFKITKPLAVPNPELILGGKPNK